MRVENPFRLAVAVLLVVILILGAYLAFGNGPGGPSAPVGRPLAAQAAPSKIAQVLTATQAVKSVVIEQTGQGSAIKQELDIAHDEAATFTAGKLTFLQLGKVMYAPSPAGCFEHGTRHSAALANIAGTLLPAGVAGFSYTFPSAATIAWKLTPAAGTYAPHGQVTIDAAHRIVAATVYSGAGVPQKTAVSYPARVTLPGAPTDVCAG